MKRDKILLEKVEEREDDLTEYLELLFCEDIIDEYLDEEREEDLMDFLEFLSYVERMMEK